MSVCTDGSTSVAALTGLYSNVSIYYKLFGVFKYVFVTKTNFCGTFSLKAKTPIWFMAKQIHQQLVYLTTQYSSSFTSNKRKKS